MTDFWMSLPAPVQDGLVLIALLFPAMLIGLYLLRGYAPWPVVRAMLWRFRWANFVFTLLVATSVGMGVGLLAQERALRQGTAAAAEKFDLVIAAPGSEITMMLAAVYLQPSDVPLISGKTFNEIASAEEVAIAAPLAFGDSSGQSPIVGTTAEFVTYLTDARIDGRLWQHHDEAVAGAMTGLGIGDTFEAAHGHGDAADHDAHGDAHQRIVGVMGPTGTPWDNAILIPIESVWEVHGLANGHSPEHSGHLGPPFDADYFPGTPAVVVHAEELWANYALRSRFTRDGETMAFFPGTVLSRIHSVMGDMRQAMSIMALVTQGLVALSILVGLFILTRLFQRQLAVLRALGAPSRFVCAVIWSYASLLLGTGALGGILLGVGAARVLSMILTNRTGVLISATLAWPEIHLVAGFAGLVSVLALLPALAMLRLPVVEGLRS